MKHQDNDRNNYSIHNNKTADVSSQNKNKNKNYSQNDNSETASARFESISKHAHTHICYFCFHLYFCYLVYNNICLSINQEML